MRLMCRDGTVLVGIGGAGGGGVLCTCTKRQNSALGMALVIMVKCTHWC